MPRTPNKSTTVKVEPYPISSSQSSGSDTETKHQVGGKPSGRTGKGTSWTGAEQKQLLHFALNRNGRSWGEAVPGRTANQAFCPWKKLLPYLEKAAEDRGK